MSEQDELLLETELHKELLVILLHYLGLMKARPDLDYRNELVSELIAKAKQHYHPSIEAQKLQVELAKKQERERILEVIKPYLTHNHNPLLQIKYCAGCLIEQALKGGKKQ